MNEDTTNRTEVTNNKNDAEVAAETRSSVLVTQEKQGIFAYVRGLPPQKRKAVQSRTYAAFVMKRS